MTEGYLRRQASRNVPSQISGEQRSGILAVDLETLEVRVLTEEWGVSEVHQTDDGPVVVFRARPAAARGGTCRHLVGPSRGPIRRLTRTGPATFHFPRTSAAAATGYDAPDGYILMWPGSPGPEPRDSEPEFTLLDILSGEELTFPYERDPPR